MSYPNDPFHRQDSAGQPPANQFGPPYNQPPANQFGPPYNQPPANQFGPPQPNPYGLPPYGYGPTPQPERKVLKWVVLSFVGLLMIACVGGSLFVRHATSGLIETSKTELASAELAVDQFMRAGAANNASAAARVADSSFSQREIAQMFKQTRLFDGYSATTANPFAVNTSAQSGDSTLLVTGEIAYASGPNGIFTAELTKQGASWKIRSISIQR